MASQDDDRRSKKASSNSASAMLGVGLEMGLLIGGMTFLGHLADNQWGIAPYGVLAGAILGMVGGCLSAYRVVNPRPRKPPKQSGKKTRTKDRHP